MNTPDRRLAIEGGLPTVASGPLPWPVDNAAVRAALVAAYDDGSWARYQGRHGEALSAALRGTFGMSGVMGCASGTVAVQLALRGLRVGPGDEVLLAGYDYPGNFRAIEAVGARPVLVDVDARTWQIDAAQLDEAWSPATRAVIVSALHGGLPAMDAIAEFARRRSVAVIEDICQAPGARFRGRPLGTFGDVAVLSFGGSKLVTAGRGGAVLTRHDDVFQRIKIACELGNHAYPLSELQAAVVLPQWWQLAERNEQRWRAARRICERLAAGPAARVLRPLVDFSEATASAATANLSLPVFYKLGFRYDPTALRDTSRADFLAAVQAEGVALDEGFRGFVHRGARRCRVVGELVQARSAAANCVVLHHPVLLADDALLDLFATAIERVVVAL